mgnify:CR=1 FL=1|tara:strand:- start:627 stop:1115 length:489 start_codon:yes stop_codon:yes gene_type:complete
MNTIQLAVTILILSTFIGCSNSNSLRIDKDIINGWDIEESIKFEINDTIDFYSNIFFYIRNNNDYPFSNIFLIATLKSNRKTYQTDTLEYLMANSKGEWLGKGFSGVKESKLFWERKWKPNFAPPYIFEIKQANRKIGQLKGDKKLFGIVSFGLSIERILNE